MKLGACQVGPNSDPNDYDTGKLSVENVVATFNYCKLIGVRYCQGYEVNGSAFQAYLNSLKHPKKPSAPIGPTYPVPIDIPAMPIGWEPSGLQQPHQIKPTSHPT